MQALAVGMMGTGGGSGQAGGMLGMLVPMAVIFLIFYFMLVRPQMRREKERKQMLSSVKTGDRVLFSGGILGTVTNVKEHTLMIKVADNVKIEVASGAVAKVLEKGEKAEAVPER